MSGRIFLVGENNPYGPDPEFALYPSPRGCAGWRMCHVILGMDPDRYCEVFERLNLLSAPKWSIREARAAAGEFVSRMESGDRAVLLGSKVAEAFAPRIGQRLSAFSISGSGHFAALPHPSGLCRVWQEKGAVEQARKLMRSFAPEVFEPRAAGEKGQEP